MAKVYISIGANVDPRKNIEKCLSLLDNQFRIIAESDWYETSPYDSIGQGHFVYLALVIETHLSPKALNEFLSSIAERIAKKQTKKAQGTMPHDIVTNILLYEDLILKKNELIIPHQDLLDCDFMLIPLSQVAPEVVHPFTKKPLRCYKKIQKRYIIKKYKKTMLKGKTALVTGSAVRTGKAIAMALAEEGAEVIIHYNQSKEEALETVKAIKQNDGKAYALKADLQKYPQVEKLIHHIIERSSKIDILVNNVGNFISKKIDKIAPEEWNYLINTTVNTTFYMCKAALPQMQKQKFGRIVNMAESGADMIRACSDCVPYMIGKTGVLILSKSLAKHYARDNITVNCVSPGLLDNSVVKPKAGENSIPKGMFAQYEDITNAILFFLKEESSYVTGANIKVSGGWNV